MTHQSVLADEVIRELALTPGMSVVDCTLGAGGHSLLMLEAIGPVGRLLGLDADPVAVENSKKRLSEFNNFQLVNAWFSELESVARDHHFNEVDAILFDLGFSSVQLDDPERGLSFQADGPLDMRLGPDAKTTAYELINRGSEKQLNEIFFNYGELYDSRRLTKSIIEARRKQSISSTLQLVKILGLSNPGVKAKLFQALRIAVNGELDRLAEALPQAVALLKPNGRLAVISFHSLEDRIVKNFIKSNYQLENLTKKPIVPTETEISQNSRSRSAKLRIARKIVG